MNTTNSQTTVNILKEDSVTSLFNSYPDLNVDAVQAADNNKYANGFG